MNNHPDGDGRMGFHLHWSNFGLEGYWCVPEEEGSSFQKGRQSLDRLSDNGYLRIVRGTVYKGIRQYHGIGVFIDLEGLIHISELSWGRVVHPADIVSLGENLEVMVIDVSPERCRVALSLKRLQPNPWETVRDRYLINDIVPATVTTIVSFGAFARLEEGLKVDPYLKSGSKRKGCQGNSTPGSKINVRILQVNSASTLGIKFQTWRKYCINHE
jgi:ribosomal protein S1